MVSASTVLPTPHDNDERLTDTTSSQQRRCALGPAPPTAGLSVDLLTKGGWIRRTEDACLHGYTGTRPCHVLLLTLEALPAWQSLEPGSLVRAFASFFTSLKLLAIGLICCVYPGLHDAFEGCHGLRIHALKKVRRVRIFFLCIHGGQQVAVDATARCQPQVLSRYTVPNLNSEKYKIQNKTCLDKL
jgi:hypothetical protein